MANTPKMSTTRTGYDALILQHAQDALARSYWVLRETDALVAFRDRRPAKLGTNPKPRRKGE